MAPRWRVSAGFTIGGASPTLNTYAGRDVKIMVYEDAHDVRDER